MCRIEAFEGLGRSQGYLHAAEEALAQPDRLAIRSAIAQELCELEVRIA